MTNTTRADFEAWLDEPHPQNPVRTKRDCFGELGCKIAEHTWQAATLKATLAEPMEHVATVAATPMRTDIGWLKAVPHNTKLFAALALPPTGTEQDKSC